jgi:hypothetical protein
MIQNIMKFKRRLETKKQYMWRSMPTMGVGHPSHIRMYREKKNGKME